MLPFVCRVFDCFDGASQFVCWFRLFLFIVFQYTNRGSWIPWVLNPLWNPRKSSKNHWNPSKSLEIPRNPSESIEIPRNPSKSLDIPRKILLVFWFFQIFWLNKRYGSRTHGIQDPWYIYRNAELSQGNLYEVGSHCFRQPERLGTQYWNPKLAFFGQFCVDLRRFCVNLRRFCINLRRFYINLRRCCVDFTLICVNLRRFASVCDGLRRFYVDFALILQDFVWECPTER